MPLTPPQKNTLELIQCLDDIIKMMKEPYATLEHCIDMIEGHARYIEREMTGDT
jgi:hypothetical protein